jgi:hypothetical protein
MAQSVPVFSSSSLSFVSPLSDRQAFANASRPNLGRSDSRSKIIKLHFGSACFST